MDTVTNYEFLVDSITVYQKLKNLDKKTVDSRDSITVILSYCHQSLFPVFLGRQYAFNGGEARA